jgi:hypothetical protein
MNTNNPKRFGWEKEADGTQLTLEQAGVKMILAEKAAQLATADLQHWLNAKQGELINLGPSLKPLDITFVCNSGYSDYSMADGKVFERKRSNSKIWLAVALAMIAGSAIAVLEISGWLPQILPTALGGGPL